MVAEKAVGPQRVTPERLHDQEVVQLVPLLGVVHLAQLRAAPPAERLVQVEHRHVCEVGDARNDLKEPEALDGPLVEERVQEQAPHIIQFSRDRMRVDAAARRLGADQRTEDGGRNSDSGAAPCRHCQDSAAAAGLGSLT